MSESAPCYVICHCQHCDGKIEFDSHQLDPGQSSTVCCPHCQLETQIYDSPETQPPPIPPIIPRESKIPLYKHKLTALQVLAIIGIALGSVIGFGVFSSTFENGVQSLKTLAVIAVGWLVVVTPLSLVYLRCGPAFKAARIAKQRGLRVEEGAIQLIAYASRDTSGDLLRRLNYVANFALQQHATGPVTLEVARLALESLAAAESESGRIAKASNHFLKCLSILGLKQPITPASIDGFVGQARIKLKVITALIEALESRGQPPHMLLIGPSGIGKTTLALLMAEQISSAAGRNYTVAGSESVQEFAQLTALFTNFSDNEVFLLDNIERLADSSAFHLPTAIADYQINTTIYEGNTPRPIQLNLPRFTLIATATDKKKLSPLLLASFRIIETLDEYSDTEIAGICRRFAGVLNLVIDEQATCLICQQAEHNPGNLLYLLELTRVFTRVRNPLQTITIEVVNEVLETMPAAKSDDEADKRRSIPSEVKREVWRRDKGKCTKCGSRENLEYDHIIPVAKGGSNTARNIELLCESCNRSKSDSIQ